MFPRRLQAVKWLCHSAINWCSLYCVKVSGEVGWGLSWGDIYLVQPNTKGPYVCSQFSVSVSGRWGVGEKFRWSWRLITVEGEGYIFSSESECWVLAYRMITISKRWLCILSYVYDINDTTSRFSSKLIDLHCSKTEQSIEKKWKGVYIISRLHNPSKWDDERSQTFLCLLLGFSKS